MSFSFGAGFFNIFCFSIGMSAKTQWAWLVLGWPLIILCSLFLGWSLPEFSLASWYIWALWALAGVVAFKVGASLEYLGRMPHSKNTSFVLWCLWGVVAAFIPSTMSMDFSSTRIGLASQKSYDIIILVIAGLILLSACGALLEKFDGGDEKPPSPGVVSRWLSMSAMAVVACGLVVFGWNTALLHQNDPQTVPGLWNERGEAVQLYIHGHLSEKDLFAHLSDLEKARKEMQPRMFFQNIAEQSLFLTGDEWCEANGKKFRIAFSCSDILNPVERRLPMIAERDYTGFLAKLHQ